ncbi:hypothetical protein LXL04_037562 [Taraxacum kok-saghyz]
MEEEMEFHLPVGFLACEKECIRGGIIRMGNNSSQSHSPTLVNLPTVKIRQVFKLQRLLQMDFVEMMMKIGLENNMLKESAHKVFVEMLKKKVFHRYGLQKRNLPQTGLLSGIAYYRINLHITTKIPNDAGNPNFLPPSLSIGVLKKIGQRCGFKIPKRNDNAES